VTGTINRIQDWQREQWRNDVIKLALKQNAQQIPRYRISEIISNRSSPANPICGLLGNLHNIWPQSCARRIPLLKSTPVQLIHLSGSAIVRHQL